jgi:hypothetical protein
MYVLIRKRLRHFESWAWGHDPHPDVTRNVTLGWAVADSSEIRLGHGREWNYFGANKNPSL